MRVWEWFTYVNTITLPILFIQSQKYKSTKPFKYHRISAKAMRSNPVIHLLAFTNYSSISLSYITLHILHIVKAYWVNQVKLALIYFGYLWMLLYVRNADRCCLWPCFCLCKCYCWNSGMHYQHEWFYNCKEDMLFILVSSFEYEP